MPDAPRSAESLMGEAVTSREIAAEFMDEGRPWEARVALAQVDATIANAAQLGRIAKLAGDAVSSEGLEAALLNVERTAREVTALLDGGPSSDPPGWTLDGEPISAGAADALLRMHDYLNDAAREHDRAVDAPAPAGFEGETRL